MIKPSFHKERTKEKLFSHSNFHQKPPKISQNLRASALSKLKKETIGGKPL